LRRLRRSITLREIGETIGHGDRCMSESFRGKQATAGRSSRRCAN
jgi:hypothetical protein